MNQLTLTDGTLVQTGARFAPVDGPIDGPSPSVRVSPWRLSLWRVWNAREPRMVWVMLNPSTADACDDDATIRKCIGFARRHSFGSIEVVNLFALRSRDPRALDKPAIDPVGPGNDDVIREATAAAAAACPGSIFCGWGAHRAPHVMQRARFVVEKLLPRQPVFALGLTNGGSPKHPLFVPYSAVPVEFARERLTRGGS